MANIAIISKTPDSLLPEIIPTTICQWQTGTGRTIYCIRMWAFSQYFCIFAPLNCFRPQFWSLPCCFSDKPVRQSMSFKKILISQTAPSNLAAYTALEEKYGVKIDFYPFFKIEPLTSKEFRTQRINLADYTAVVFSSRATIDSYFKLCEEARFKVPETMKYFCTSELVAMYLQKHIVFRKRKIFFGDGTPDSILKLIGS